MSPSVTYQTRVPVVNLQAENQNTTSALLYGNQLCGPPPRIVNQKGNWVYLDDGTKYLDASGGPALTSVGYRNERVKNAMIKQLSSVGVGNDISFRTHVSEELAQELSKSTCYKMAAAAIYGSGSAATDGTLKLARQYFVELGELKRTKFIARKQSYHGATLGALSLSGFPSRRQIYEPLLNHNVGFVSPCDPLRGRRENESDEDYVQRLAKELDDKFIEMGSDTVIAFWAETVVGAALGAVPAVPGYFKALKEICMKHGALFIADEVMSGTGRCGGPGLHAWQQEVGFVPDIQTMGKGLTGGYAPVGAVLASRHVLDVFKRGTGEFAHGQTFQGHPTTCAAALEVLKIIRDEDLLENINRMGERLSRGLKASLGSHPNVGFISGKGLFWGVHFVRNKATKEPFGRAWHVAEKVYEKALKKYEIYVYRGMGSADGTKGDHIIISPAYNITEDEVDFIIEQTSKAINEVFRELDEEDHQKNGFDETYTWEKYEQELDRMYDSIERSY